MAPVESWTTTRRRDPSSRVEGAVTMPTIATFRSVKAAGGGDRRGGNGRWLGARRSGGRRLRHGTGSGCPTRGRVRLGGPDDVVRVARPQAVAIEGTRAARPLPTDADDSVRRADLERGDGDATRRIGHHPDRRHARSFEHETEVATRRLGRSRRESAGHHQEASVGGFAKTGGAHVHGFGRGRRAVHSDASGGRPDLELAVRGRQRATDHDDRPPRRCDRAGRKSDGDATGPVADGHESWCAGASGLGGHDAPCRDHGPDRRARMAAIDSGRGRRGHGRCRAGAWRDAGRRRGRRGRSRAGGRRRGRRRDGRGASRWGGRRGVGEGVTTVKSPASVAYTR